MEERNSLAPIPLPANDRGVMTKEWGQRNGGEKFPCLHSFARQHSFARKEVGMPIHCPLIIRPIADGAFAEIDRLVMACAYASQNVLGRLCDERVYENDLAARLRAKGIADVQTQAPVTVTHGDFSKTYRLDLVVKQMVYELKAVANLTPEHDAQAIHYAALLAINRVKLLNFRSANVVGRLIGAPFGRLDRTEVTCVEAGWRPLSDRCEGLKQWMRALLADWGAYLEGRLYEEGLVHFHGGEEACICRTPLVRDGIELGTHRVQCHAARPLLDYGGEGRLQENRSQRRQAASQSGRAH
jgi:GxxExxY protein